ncbi:HEAT repeat domain-containing protein [Actinosynnema sp. NPDC023658]|uniref:HEAT repeat domain-containing protein n=1 Tax=Actinosynnema sp. NPDC023658 TaxID=3155465 RepID=UPI0033C84848
MRDTGNVAEVWDRLEHAYGPATDVPGLVAQVRDPVTAPAAIGELNANVYHNGDAVYSAAPALLPHLLDLAEDPAVTVRPAVVDTIGDLAHAAATAEPHAVHEDWPRAWAAAVPRLLRLLMDPDVEVRRVVTFPLAQALGHDVWPHLRDRFAAEPDRAARLGLVVATAHHADPAARDWLTGLLADRTVHLAAAVGLRRLGVTPDVRSLLPGFADLAGWADTWFVGNQSAAAVVWWVNRELRDDRTTRRTLVAELLDHPDPDVRAGALWASAQLLDQTLLPLIADRLPDDEPENRRLAATLLASAHTSSPPPANAPAAGPASPSTDPASPAAGPVSPSVGPLSPADSPALLSAASPTPPAGSPPPPADRPVPPAANPPLPVDGLAPFADDLALAARDVYLPAADAALAALALLGDARAVEPLRQRLGGARLGLTTRPKVRPWSLPPLDQVLIAMRHHADALLPAVHARLDTTPDHAERAALGRVLASWGGRA